MYRTVWKFAVRADRVAEFERAYGSDGEWAALFRTAPGYLGTDLLRSLSAPLEYVTIDSWESKETYAQFRRERADEYRRLDALFESLTEREEHLAESSD